MPESWFRCLGRSPSRSERIWNDREVSRLYYWYEGVERANDTRTNHYQSTGTGPEKSKEKAEETGDKSKQSDIIEKR